MNPRAIKHMTLAHVDDVNHQLRAQVLEEAHKRFGYQADEFAQAGPLAATLVRLDIAPLDTDQVNRYMQRKKITFTRNPKPWLHAAITLLAVGVGFGLWMTWTHFWTVLPLFQVTHSYPTVTTTPEYGGIAFCSIFPAMMTGVILNLIVGFAPLQKRRYTRDWELYGLGGQPGSDRQSGRNLNQYPRYIPVHVLNLACQIERECPEASFGVYELTEKVKDVPLPLPDPFLVVQRGSERYFIAVWDEREFEAKL